MFLDTKISIYSNTTDNVGYVGTIGDFLQMGFNHREDIDILRSTISKEERSRLKRMLPAATISGVFAKRNANNLTQHSGLICIDIDNISNCSETIAKLANMDIVAYVSRSVGGNGVFAIIPIAFPNKHLQQWEALQRYFHNQGIEIDKACKDVARLRICSYDNEAIIRENATAFQGIYEQKPQPIKHCDYVGDNDTEKHVSYCVKQIATLHVDICSSYDSWLKVGFSLANALGGAGRSYFHTISSQSPKYNTAECDRKFDECLRSVKTCSIGYFFNLCKDYNINIRSSD